MDVYIHIYRYGCIHMYVYVHIYKHMLVYVNVYRICCTQIYTHIYDFDFSQAEQKRMCGQGHQVAHRIVRGPAMASSLLASVLESECRQILPQSPGRHLTWGGLVLAILFSFLAGCCCGAALLGALGVGVCQWWFAAPKRQLPLSLCKEPSHGRLTGYKLH